jgi:hypothetical protein
MSPSTIANSSASPLLHLPAEIRKMIFIYASSFIYYRIDLMINRRGSITRSGFSTHLMQSKRKDLAIDLPRVCGQIYAETGTLIYS